MIITIDGPAGSGKSTTARAIAAKTGATYLDTGAMYRSVTLKALESGIDVTNETALEKLSAEISIAFKESENGQRTIVDGKDRTEDIRSKRVEASVSAVAACAGVREEMVALQRKIGREASKVVLEGRDTGSVVFPDADYKFYLKANDTARAMRRSKQSGGKPEDIQKVTDDIRSRDHKDSNRKASPLVIPDGAVVIDNTNLTVDETVEKIIVSLV